MMLHITPLESLHQSLTEEFRQLERQLDERLPVSAPTSEHAAWTRAAGGAAGTTTSIFYLYDTTAFWSYGQFKVNFYKIGGWG